MRRELVGAALLAAACGDHGLVYEGEPGAPIAVDLTGWVPVVEARADGAAGRFLVDTGAPFSALDTAAFPTLAPGPRCVDLEAFGLRFPDRPVTVLDLFPGAAAAPDGLLGAELLRHFALTIDYRGGRLWLDGTPAAGAVAVAARVGGDPPARLLVAVSLEDGPPVWALVDSGAGAVLVDEEVLSRLGPAARPRLDGVTVATADGPLPGYLTRVASLELVGAGNGGAGPALAGPAVLVLPGRRPLAGLEAEVGVPVEILLGGSFLRWFEATLDYPGAALALAPYPEPDHVDPDEYVGVGFALVRAGDRWRVGDVYPGTDAERAGLRRDDEVTALDGVAIGALDRPAVDAVLARFGLGDPVPVELRRDAAIATVAVAVEDLLPAYPTPDPV